MQWDVINWTLEEEKIVSDVQEEEDCLLIVPHIITTTATASARAVKNYKVHRLTYHNCCQHIRRLIWKLKRRSTHWDDQSDSVPDSTNIGVMKSLACNIKTVCLCVENIIFWFFSLVNVRGGHLSHSSIWHFWKHRQLLQSLLQQHQQRQAAREWEGLRRRRKPSELQVSRVNIWQSPLNDKLRFGGKDYLVSWRIGCSQFTQAGAEHFCRQNGMR